MPNDVKKYLRRATSYGVTPSDQSEKRSVTNRGVCRDNYSVDAITFSIPERCLMPLPERVRPIDACAYLGVSMVTLKKWIQAGKLPPPIRATYHYIYWPRDTIGPVLNALKQPA